jgi:hypothetical protein
MCFLKKYLWLVWILIYLWIVWILNLIYVLWCATMLYVDVICGIDLIASRHVYHLITLPLNTHQLHDLYVEAPMCSYLSVL